MRISGEIDEVSGERTYDLYAIYDVDGLPMLGVYPSREDALEGLHNRAPGWTAEIRVISADMAREEFFAVVRYRNGEPSTTMCIDDYLSGGTSWRPT